MSFKPLSSTHLASYLAILMLLALEVVPSVLALDRPAISVNPVWRPATQLSTLDAGVAGVTEVGDDLRYVDADIFVTTSVLFWAAEVTCTVDRTALETYIPNTDTGAGPLGGGFNAPDDVQPVTYGPEWTAGLGNFLHTVVNTVNADGKINFAATRIGLDSPMGSNGVRKTFLLATLRYRTKILAATKTSALTCTAAFLDKNGKPVLVPTVVAPPPLRIIPGYTIKGKVMYQDQTVQTGINVTCRDSAGVFHNPVTPVTPAGDFTIMTRDLGTHECFFDGSKINADTTTEESHLQARAVFKLNSAVFNLLPVTLRTGNVNRDGNRIIDFADFSMITSNWNTTTLTPYTNGDANGDRKIDRSDLALVAGNYFGSGLSEPVNLSHFIYSLPRDNERFMNSRIWIGGYYGDASVSQFVPGTDRNYWATLSPDGGRIAFVRNIGAGKADKFALMVAPVTGGVVGAAVNITPSAPFDAFAPSWSPDGSTLAFACAYSRADWTQGNGRAHLCFVGPDGRNLRQKVPLAASNQMINIHPVAWFNNTSMMYGGPDWTGLLPLTPDCNNRVCRLDLTTMLNTFETNISVGSDMPTIRYGTMGPVVFYRQSQGTADDVIRFAELQEVATFPSAVTSFVANVSCSSIPFKHCNVATGVNFNQVGYFNVYTGNNNSGANQYGIVFYSQDENTSSGGGINYTLLDWNGSAISPSWIKTYPTYSVSNVVGNPNITPLNTPSSPNPEGYLALRNTVEWVP